MGTLRTALRESLLILAGAVFLSLAYAGITQKGLFSRFQGPVEEAHRTPQVITLEEAKELFESGRAAFVDVRDEAAFREGHIRGAIHVYLHDLPLHMEFLKVLSGQKTLVPYCDGADCHSSVEFGRRLLAAGISEVKVFFGGWEEWTASRLPTEKPAP